MAVVAPGLAVGGFDGVGEGGVVHEGGGFHAVAEGAAEVGEAGEVLGEGDGEGDEVGGGLAGEFGEGEVIELGPGGAAEEAVADDGGDGDAHEEGVHTGRVAVAGEGVEGEVDLVIELVVIAGGEAVGEADAAGGDAVGVEITGYAVAVGARGCEEEELGVGEGVHDLDPEVVNAFVEFAEVIEVAEGEVAVGEGGKVVDGDFDGGVVAPEGVGQAEGFFGGGKGGASGGSR